ncbi:MAG: hypothetical protein ABIE43_03565 [Patescibacteria group bacterium]
MTTNNIQSKTYTCMYCKEMSEVVGIIQTERHYYSFDISTNQLEDFHGDQSVESQEFFCLNCNKKINN